jgi:hypothetical protein
MQGFWAYDVALGVFLKHLIDVAEEQEAKAPEIWLTQAIPRWRVVACAGPYQVLINPGWSAEQLNTFTSLAKEACSRIRRRELFTSTELEGWNILDGEGIFPRGDKEIHTGPIVDLGEAIVALVTGVLPAAPRGTAWFFGTPSGRKTIAMREEWPEVMATRQKANMSMVSTPVRKTPWHLWVVAILTLLWNGSGAYTIMMAQTGRLPDVSADEAAYYTAQPFWFVISTDIALLSAVVGAVALLLRRRMAGWLFALSLAAFVVNNAYDLAAGTSLVLVDRGWLMVKVIIAVIAVLQLTYAWVMRKRAVLR